MMPQSLSLLLVAFPSEKRGAAMGAWGSVVALGAIIGPVVGGLILGLIAAAVVLLTAFIIWEMRVAEPMMKIELFKIRNFWVGNVIALAIAFGMLGIFFPMTLFLRQVLGFSPIRAGLTMTSMSAMILIAAPLAGRLTDKIGARWILVTGTGLMAVCIFFIISRIDLNTDWTTLFPALIVTGLGIGMTFAPITAAAMREVPPRIAGSTSGIINTMRNIGQILGIAFLGSFLQNRIGLHTSDALSNSGLEPGTVDGIIGYAKQDQLAEMATLVPSSTLNEIVTPALRAAFVDALHNTFLIGALACVVAAAVSLLIRNPPPRRATSTVERAKQDVVAMAMVE